MKHTRFDKKLISEEELEFLQQHISQKLVDRVTQETFIQVTNRISSPWVRFLTLGRR